MELVLFIGIQGSGKSSFYKERFVDSHIRLNLDMLRTRHRERILFEACIRAKQRVVVDNTNPTIRDRARYIGAAKQGGFRVIGYCFQSELKECLKRNQLRPAKQLIPVEGVLATFHRLEPPRKAEGFDELYHVRIAGPGSFQVRPFVEVAEKKASEIPG